MKKVLEEEQEEEERIKDSYFLGDCKFYLCLLLEHKKKKKQAATKSLKIYKFAQKNQNATQKLAFNAKFNKN